MEPKHLGHSHSTTCTLPAPLNMQTFKLEYANDHPSLAVLKIDPLAVSTQFVRLEVFSTATVELLG